MLSVAMDLLKPPALPPVAPMPPKGEFDRALQAASATPAEPAAATSTSASAAATPSTTPTAAESTSEPTSEPTSQRRRDNSKEPAAAVASSESASANKPEVEPAARRDELPAGAKSSKHKPKKDEQAKSDKAEEPVAYDPLAQKVEAPDEVVVDEVILDPTVEKKVEELEAAEQTKSTEDGAGVPYLNEVIAAVVQEPSAPSETTASGEEAIIGVPGTGASAATKTPDDLPTGNAPRPTPAVAEAAFETAEQDLTSEDATSEDRAEGVVAKGETTVAAKSDGQAKTETPAAVSVKALPVSVKAATVSAETPREEQLSNEGETPGEGEATGDAPIKSEGRSRKSSHEEEPSTARDKNSSVEPSANRSAIVAAEAAPAEPIESQVPGEVSQAASPDAATSVTDASQTTTPDSIKDTAAPRPADRLEAATANKSTGATSAANQQDAVREVDRVRFVQRVARAFQAADDRGGEIRLRLSPPELGSMRLEVSLRDGVMTARMETESAAARTVLLENLPALRERLAEHNVKIERFDVQLSNGQSGDSSGQSREQQQHASPRHQPWHTRAGGSAAAASSEAAPRASVASHNSQLNIVI